MDTSSLRKLGAGPLALGDAFKPTTGALVVLELVAAALSSADEHERVRPACQHLETAIEVDWRLPEEILVSAFAVIGFTLQFDDARRAPLKKLLHVEATSSHLELLAAAPLAEAQAGLSQGFFVRLDERLATAWPELAAVAHAKARSELKTLPRDQVKEIRALLREDEGFDVSVGITREVLFGLVAELVNEQQPNSRVTVDQLRRVYMGDLETFVRAWAWSSNDLFVRGATARRNDGIDLMHFYYFDRAIVLGSHDERMLEIANAIDVHAVRPTR